MNCYLALTCVINEHLSIINESRVIMKVFIGYYTISKSAGDLGSRTVGSHCYMVHMVTHVV